MAATLSQASIKHVEVLDMEELGMEAVWKIQVEDFPAFIIVDAYVCSNPKLERFFSIQFKL